MVNAMEDIEHLMQATNSTLNQVKYTKRKICVEVQTLQIEPFLLLIPPKAVIKDRNTLAGVVKYCYEKI